MTVALTSSVAGNPRVFTAPDHIHSKKKNRRTRRTLSPQAVSFWSFALSASCLSAPIHSDEVLNSLRQVGPQPLQASSLPRRAERFEVCKRILILPFVTSSHMYNTIGAEVYCAGMRPSPCHPLFICVVPENFDISTLGTSPTCVILLRVPQEV